MNSIRTMTCRLLLVLSLLGGPFLEIFQGMPLPWAGEYDLKAAFVYNLLPFIDLPEAALGDQIIIGFAGEGPMGAALSKILKGKRFGARAIEFREVHSLDEMRACNIVFFAYPDDSRLKEALMHIHGTSVLSIGDGERFARLGGIIAFVPHENKFQLTINPQAAGRAHIKLSSKLLSMAKLLPDDETVTRSRP